MTKIFLISIFLCVTTLEKTCAIDKDPLKSLVLFFHVGQQPLLGHGLDRFRRPFKQQVKVPLLQLAAFAREPKGRAQIARLERVQHHRPDRVGRVVLEQLDHCQSHKSEQEDV